jgi:hypothetical protein
LEEAIDLSGDRQILDLDLVLCRFCGYRRYAGLSDPPGGDRLKPETCRYIVHVTAIKINCYLINLINQCNYLITARFEQIADLPCHRDNEQQQGQ